MKIKIGFIIQLSLLLCLCICCNKDKYDEDEIDYSLIDPKTGAYTFPVRPGTPEWEKLESSAEMIAALQIPENILNILTDSGLLNTCFNYPLASGYQMSNSIPGGIETMISQFNFFQELIRRPGIPPLMLFKYKKL